MGNGVFLKNFFCSLIGDHPFEDVEKMTINPRRIRPNLAINHV
jgi:hypothetical protein